MCKSKKEHRPDISVIIITRNTPFMILKRCIHCIRSQTLENIEIILLDANEKGNSYQKAISSEGELLRDITYVYYPEDGEMVHGKNLALEKATGNYITIISAQDMMTETRLETILRAFRDNSRQLVYYTSMTFQVDNTLENNYYTLPTGSFRYLAQAVIHRSVFSMAGNFDENMLCLCDEELWTRINFINPPGCLMDEDAAISICQDSYKNHTPLNAAIAYRQILIKFPKYFNRHKAHRRILYQKITENYKESHVILRYLQFRWKTIFSK